MFPTASLSAVDEPTEKQRTGEQPENQPLEQQPTDVPRTGLPPTGSLPAVRQADRCRACGRHAGAAAKQARRVATGASKCRVGDPRGVRRPANRQAAVGQHFGAAAGRAADGRHAGGGAGWVPSGPRRGRKSLLVWNLKVRSR